MYTTSTPTTASANRLAIARVAAGCRRAADRRAAQRRQRRHLMIKWSAADLILADLIRDGAVRIGFKVCDDQGKYRYSADLTTAEGFGYALTDLVHYYGADVEVSGIRADGSFCENVH